MDFFSRITQVLALMKLYVPVAEAVVKEVETTGLPGATKKQIAVSTVLAVVHAGQKVDNTKIQTVSMVIEMVVGIQNAGGLFGKAAKPVVIDVPEEGATA